MNPKMTHIYRQFRTRDMLELELFTTYQTTKTPISGGRVQIARALTKVIYYTPPLQARTVDTSDFKSGHLSLSAPMSSNVRYSVGWYVPSHAALHTALAALKRPAKVFTEIGLP